MECPAPKAAGTFRADYRGNAVRHFCSGLVGERQRQHLMGSKAVLQQVGHLIGQHPRLPRSCTCQHQHRAVHIAYGFPLPAVKACLPEGLRPRLATLNPVPFLVGHKSLFFSVLFSFFSFFGGGEAGRGSVCPRWILFYGPPPPLSMSPPLPSGRRRWAIPPSWRQQGRVAVSSCRTSPSFLHRRAACRAVLP